MIGLFIPLQFKPKKNTAGILLTLMLSFSLTSAEAKKMYYPLEVVIGLADLIVTGQIANISTDSYTFNIDQTVKGFSNKQIKVKMFKEWECDTRVKKVEIGQKLFLFLKGNSIGSYDIINGSTGEIFILDNEIHGFTNYEKTTKLDHVIIAIKNFISCYLFTDKEYSPLRRNAFRQIKKSQDIFALGNANAFSSWLFGNMKYYTTSKTQQKIKTTGNNA